MRTKLLSLTLLLGLLAPLRAENFSEAFQNPPASTKPGVYWYWISGNISKDGITKDLEAMKRVGIGRAYISTVNPTAEGQGPVKMLSEDWWQMTMHAIREGGRLGIDIGVFNCPGWSQSGGPWIKPEQSMRYLTSSETKVTGPAPFSSVLSVPKTPFQDVVVLAVPEPLEDRTTAIMKKAQVTLTPGGGNATALLDGNLKTVCPIAVSQGANPLVEVKKSFVVDIKSPEEVTIRSLSIAPDKVQLKVECEFQYKDATGRFQSVKKFTLERLNKLQEGPMVFGPVTEAFPAIKGKEFRLIFSKLLQKGTAGIAEITLSEAPQLEHYVEKQLGKTFQYPHPEWNSYVWPMQPDAGKSVLFTQSSQIINISKFMDAKGKLTWDVPKGNWTILRVGMVPTGVHNAPAPPEATGLEVDKMNATHVKGHFDAYLGKLMDCMPAEERKAWKYAVIDSYEMGSQDWTDKLEEEFQARYHYDPLFWLPTLTGRVVDNPDKSNRFLWDLRRLVSDKVAHSYIQPLREAANGRGLKLWLENYGHAGFPAESLQYGGQSDDIAGEFWANCELGSIELRQASSAAHIYGKAVVDAESFTAGAGIWTQSPWSLKPRSDWAMAEGINHYTLHLYIHQSTDRVPGINAWFGTEFNRNNTWFSDMDGWIASFRRTHGVLQQGHYVADVAYFFGEDAPQMTGVREPGLPPGYNFDYLNGEILARDLQVKDGKFVLPDGMSYRLLVLPPLDTMRPELLQKIADLVKAGGAVLGEPPLRSPSLQNYPVCDQQVRNLAGEMWKGIDGKQVTSGRYGKGWVFRGTDVATALKTAGVPADIEGIGERPEIGKPGMTWTHRQTENADVYFLANTSDEKQTLSLSFRVGEGAPELWDPVSGEMRALPQFTKETGRIRVSLEFLPRQSYLVAFRKEGSASAPASRVNFPAFETFQNLGSIWKVTLDPQRGGPGEVTFDPLIDFTKHADDRIKYYSGTAIYRSTFQFDSKTRERLFLNLGGFSDIARVKLNGQDMGVVWSIPGRIEITKSLKRGANALEIAVTNTWNNRLLGDSKLPLEKRHTWTSIDAGIKPNTQLLPSGLIGPVTIEKLQP